MRTTAATVADVRDAWFPTDVAGSPATTVVCLPYAGGSTLAFRGWAEGLADVAGVRAAAPPGREQRITEPPEFDVDDLAGAIAARIDGPYVIYGHSMGARLAPPVIRRLAELGARLPEHLVVGGCRPPHLKLLTRISHLPDDAFLRRVIAMGGMTEDVVADPELRRLLLGVLRSDFAMIESLPITPPDPLPVPITALAGRDDPQAEPGEMVGWAAHTTAGFALHTIAGGHFFLHSAQDQVLEHVANAVCPAGVPAWQQPLADDEVLVIDARLDHLPELDAVEELSASERRRAERMRAPADGRRFAARSVLQRRVLAAHGLDVGTAEYQRGSGSKPAWPSPRGLTFNASHSDGIALIALSVDREIGIDVERLRPMTDLEAFADGALDAGEREEFEERAGSAALEYALRIWTAKESVLKYTGDGLRIEPDVFGFAGHEPRGPWRATTDAGFERLGAAEVRHLELPDGIGALAVPADDAEIRLRYVRLPESCP